jgi:hypothetical protein
METVSKTSNFEAPQTGQTVRDNKPTAIESDEVVVVDSLGFTSLVPPPKLEKLALPKSIAPGCSLRLADLSVKHKKALDSID